MAEKLLKFFLKFLVASAPLALFWLWKGAAGYEKFFITVVNQFSQLAQINLTLPIPSTFFPNLVPFTALMLITPPALRLGRLPLLLLGWLVIFLEHLLLSLLLYLFLDLWKLSESTYNWLFTPLSILNGTFPFLLWLFLLKKEIRSTFLRPDYSNSPK